MITAAARSANSTLTRYAGRTTAIVEVRQLTSLPLRRKEHPALKRHRGCPTTICASREFLCDGCRSNAPLLSRCFSSQAASQPSPDAESVSSLKGKELSGEECYNLALDARRQAEALEKEREERKATEQFEAMRRGHDRELKRQGDRIELTEAEGDGCLQSFAGGVAVIRTIARQTRRERDTRTGGGQTVGSDETVGRKVSGSAADDETAKDWNAVEKMWLEEAAFVHEHPKALVRLGNEALQEANDQLWIAGTDRKVSVEKLATGGIQSSRDECQTLQETTETVRPVERAIRLYQRAGEPGSPEGWYNLGHLHWTGYPPEEEDKELDADAASEHSSNALCILPSDRTKALSVFQKAIDLGDSDASFFVGVQLLSLADALPHETRIELGVPHTNVGSTVSADMVSAQRQRGLALLNDAAQHDHGGALHYLALFHRNGDTGLNIPPCVCIEFQMRLDRAAEAGHPDALYLRAHCRYHGEDGYELDYAAALKDFLASADAGSVDGYVSAGAMLHQGGFNGAVTQDRRRAFELYQEAAELGSIEGWRNVVACYALGEGVPRCEKTAEYIARTMLKGH